MYIYTLCFTHQTILNNDMPTPVNTRYLSLHSASRELRSSRKLYGYALQTLFWIFSPIYKYRASLIYESLRSLVTRKRMCFCILVRSCQEMRWQKSLRYVCSDNGHSIYQGRKTSHFGCTHWNKVSPAALVRNSPPEGRILFLFRAAIDSGVDYKLIAIQWRPWQTASCSCVHFFTANFEVS